MPKMGNTGMASCEGNLQVEPGSQQLPPLAEVLPQARQATETHRLLAI
jgi:hypothetical protein